MKQNLSNSNLNAYFNSQEFYLKVVAASPGHVYWKDINGNYLGCNDAQAKSLGLKSRLDIINYTPYEKLNTKEAQRLRRIDSEVIKYNKTYTEEEKGIRENGELGIFLTKKSPIHDENGKVIGLIGISFDITDLKKLEKARIEKEYALRLAKNHKIQAGSIAHELLTPLSSLLSLFSAVKKYYPSLVNYYLKYSENQNAPDKPKLMKSKLRALLDAIEGGASIIYRIDKFIDLTLTNLKQDKITNASFTTFNVKDAILEVIKLYPFKINERKLVNLDLNEHFLIYADKTYFHNIFNNLIKNSLYFITEQGKGNIHISLRKSLNKNEIIFCDTAKGISEEDYDSIFEGYYSETKGGTGLGLAFCKKVMKSFNGEIKVNSVKGKFMKFTLSFPKIKKLK